MSKLLLIGGIIFLFFILINSSSKFSKTSQSNPSISSQLNPTQKTEFPLVSKIPSVLPTKTPIVIKSPYATPITVTQQKTIDSNNTNGGNYSCNCSKTCPNLSCAEAQYQLNVCGCKARDADHDSIACNAQCQ